MFRIAIVEDKPDDYELIDGFLRKYGHEHNVDFKTEYFVTAMNFVENYKPKYDIIFMDIDLPLLDGMAAAKRIRQVDETVNLVFVTNLRQYAIEGYTVNALSYILKPVTYPQLETIMNRICHLLEKSKGSAIVVSTKNDSYCFDVNDVVYVAVSKNHYVDYFLASSRSTVSVTGSLKQVAMQFPSAQFALCNSGSLVNLNYVKSIKDSVVDVGYAQFTFSRPKRKDFLAALNEWKN